THRCVRGPPGPERFRPRRPRPDHAWRPSRSHSVPLPPGYRTAHNAAPSARPAATRPPAPAAAPASQRAGEAPPAPPTDTPAPATASKAAGDARGRESWGCGSRIADCGLRNPRNYRPRGPVTRPSKVQPYSEYNTFGTGERAERTHSRRAPASIRNPHPAVRSPQSQQSRHLKRRRDALHLRFVVLLGLFRGVLHRRQEGFADELWVLLQQFRIKVDREKLARSIDPNLHGAAPARNLEFLLLELRLERLDLTLHLLGLFQEFSDAGHDDMKVEV